MGRARHLAPRTGGDYGHGRSFSLKIHGSGFALGDQVELRRDDVPALGGRMQRIRAGSTAGDYRIEIAVPVEWTRDPGVLLVN